MSYSNSWNRRQFIGAGTLALSAGLVSKHLSAATSQSSKPKQIDDPKKILNYSPDMRYRRLGDTEMYLSVVSLGGDILERSLIHHALDRGVNLIHVSMQYTGGKSIRELGEVMKTRRDKVYIALKDAFQNLDDDLKILNTDHVDFLMFNRHRRNHVSDPRIRETFDRYQKQGKARLAGLTPHDDVKECMKAGIEAGFYSILMPTLNQATFQAADLELRQAMEKNIGVMAMKTMQKIEERDLQLANLKKVLANPAVTTVLKTFGNFDLLDDFINTAKETLTAEEDMKLFRHVQSVRSELCMACGECRKTCPQGIEIPLILRSHQYYLVQNGNRNLAVSTYSGLNHSAASCDSCGRCDAVCPNGISVTRQLAKAVRALEKENKRLV